MKRWITEIVWVLGLCASAAVWAVPQTAGQLEWRVQEHT